MLIRDGAKDVRDRLANCSFAAAPERLICPLAVRSCDFVQSRATPQNGCDLDYEYDIFECFPDGSIQWRDSASGLLNARQKIQELGLTSMNDYFAMRLPTREVVFRAADGRKDVVIAKRVFQIAYNEKLGKQRAEVLRSVGYGVLTVNGNDAAKTILDKLRMHSDDISLFMIGGAANPQQRKAIVDWLKSRYPKTPILVLNPPNQHTPGADYNVLENGPELWLPLITTGGRGNVSA